METVTICIDDDGRALILTGARIPIDQTRSLVWWGRRRVSARNGVRAILAGLRANWSACPRGAAYHGVACQTGISIRVTRSAPHGATPSDPALSGIPSDAPRAWIATVAGSTSPNRGGHSRMVPRNRHGNGSSVSAGPTLSAVAPLAAFARSASPATFSAHAELATAGKSVTPRAACTSVPAPLSGCAGSSLSSLSAVGGIGIRCQVTIHNEDIQLIAGIAARPAWAAVFVGLELAVCAISAFGSGLAVDIGTRAVRTLQSRDAVDRRRRGEPGSTRLSDIAAGVVALKIYGR